MGSLKKVNGKFKGSKWEEKRKLMGSFKEVNGKCKES